jgi:threonine dehydratase
MKVTLQDIHQARETLKNVIRKTEIDKSFSASKLLGAEVFLKFENQQFTGSFKLRGAYNKISKLTDDEKKRGVIASSAGNHAQGVAFSAHKAGVKSVIVMPKSAPLVKVTATKDYGAEVIQFGDIYDDAYEHAKELERKHGYIFVHPFEDPHVIAGQGTIGLEIHEALPDLESLIVPIGGGGLISGIATAVKALNPKCKIYGVQSSQTPGMQKMFKHEILDMPAKITTIADGIAVKRPSALMYESFISKLVDDIVTVTDTEIAEAIVFLIERAKSVTEGSGAAAFAALINKKVNPGKKTCVVLCGGNIDLNIISRVINQGLISKGRLIELSVIVDDIPGSLMRLTAAIAAENANILEVHHDRVAQGLYLKETRINFVLETTSIDHIERVRRALIQIGARLV